MPSKVKSPYATSFNSAVNRGSSFVNAVSSIAKRTGKTPKVIWNSLFRAGMVNRQKFNGQWVYWPVNWKRAAAGATKEAQVNNWQCFVEWCIVSGAVKPEKLDKATGSQSEFMSFCRKFFAQQFSSASKTTKRRKSSPKRKPASSARKRPSAKRSTRRSPSKTTNRKRTTTRAKARTTSRKSSTSRKSTARRTASSTRRSTTSSTRRVSSASRKRTSSRRTVSRAA